MLLITLANTVSFTSLSYVDSFILSQLFSYTIADWWVTTFGAPDESVVRSRPLVLNVRFDNVDYTRVNSYAECVALERSWYLSDTAFFVHVDHDVSFDGVICQYGNGAGFSDEGVVYVDDIEYLPLVTSAPSINKQEDIQGYQKLRLITGSVGLSNLDGRLDYLKDSSVIGNDARLAYVANEKVVDGVANPSDVVGQAAYFIEEAEYGNDEVKLALQDTRKLDKEVPTRTFDTTTYPSLDDSIDGTIVPLVYGGCRSVKCFPVNTTQAGTTAVTYRCAEFLTSISEVRVKINDTWTIRSTSSTNLANGTFTIANARSAAGEDPYECQADVVGIPVTYAPDIIIDLYSRYLGQTFIGTFYDTVAWNANKVTVPTCGLVIDKETPILEIIPLIQNGVCPTFRFDITVDGLKTIRLDDKLRAVDWFVDNVDILNKDELIPVDVSDYLFGEVTIQYDKNYFSGDWRRKTVDTYKASIQENFQWSNSTSIETLLNTPALAQAMADAKALEFSVPIRTMEVQLMGDRYFSVELFDIMQIDTANGRDEYFTGDFTGRLFLGVIVVQVIGIKPNYDDKTTDFTVKILDREPNLETAVFIGTEDGYVLTTEDGLYLAKG